MKFTAACIQNEALADMAASLDRACELARAARAAGAQLIALPEYCSCLDNKDGRFAVGAHAEPAHPALARFRALAAQLEAWLLVGSLAVSAGAGKIRNRSYLLDAQGRIAARYDKIFLFDVDLAGGESYRESALIEPGTEAVLAETPWATLGMSVCYDLRFPQLYRALAQAGAQVLTVPAAFTRTTGAAHWHVLNRARAIETGCFVLAPCQSGDHGGGRATYGHSLILDPWGRVLAEGGADVGFVAAELDPAEVDKARAMVPALAHDRPFAGPAAKAPAQQSA